MPVSRGVSVVIVDKDFHSVGNAVAIIKRKLGQEWYEADEPCVVLIDEGVKDQFLSELNSDQPAESFTKIATAGGGRIITVNEAPPDLQQALSTIVFNESRENKLPVLVTTSLDHSLDCISVLQCQHNLSQVAVFSNSKDNMAYVERFSFSDVFSVGDVMFRGPISKLDHLIAPNYLLKKIQVRDGRLTGATYSPQFFGKYRYQYHTSLPLLHPESVQQIRARYQRKIKPLPVEPRGERVDFFVKMAWLVRGVKTFMGITSLGVAYGTFLLARKCLKAL